MRVAASGKRPFTSGPQAARDPKIVIGIPLPEFWQPIGTRWVDLSSTFRVLTRDIGLQRREDEPSPSEKS
jgi:hypothetical protein